MIILLLVLATAEPAEVKGPSTLQIYEQCLAHWSGLLEPSGDQAQVIVEASSSMCRSEFDAMQEETKLKAQAVPELIPRLLELDETIATRVRELLLIDILKRRALRKNSADIGPQ